MREIQGMERSAADDLWRRTLVAIPSVFGRLVYLTSLRNANTGTYEHHGLALAYGDAAADRALRESHTRSFREWVAFRIVEQKADLDLYLSALPERKAVVVETWQRLRPYRNLVPLDAGAVEASLFARDFEILLAMLRADWGVAEPDRDASQLP